MPHLGREKKTHSHWSLKTRMLSEQKIRLYYDSNLPNLVIAIDVVVVVLYMMMMIIMIMIMIINIILLSDKKETQHAW